MEPWIIVGLLALLLLIEIRNGRCIATILVEIRDFLMAFQHRMGRLAGRRSFECIETPRRRSA